MADPTLVEVTIRFTPAQLEACAILTTSAVEDVDDLIAESSAASERFLAELAVCRDNWRALQLPLVEASKRLRDCRAVAGTIETKPKACPEQHDHNRLQARADEDGFPRVCTGCERRFERVDF